MDTSTADLVRRPAGDLAELVRSGEVTSRELIEASLERIAARPDLNAFTFVDTEGALAAADAIGSGDARPFAGVPIAIKDLSPVAGLPQGMGSRLFAGYQARHDNYAVRRLRAAGFVIVGKTATPEFGLVPVTEPLANGPTRNPWDTGRTPGGSSGGSAAAVAAGLVPLAHASDGGGSIRIPAACCGLVGLKPSRGRISPGPDLGDSFLSTQGVVTRTVRETAQLLDILAGYEPGDATWAAPPSEPFASSAAHPPRRLRIATTTVAPNNLPVDPACAWAVHEAAALLASLGHEVVEAIPVGWHNDELMPTFLILWAAGVTGSVRLGATIAGREPAADDLEPLTRTYYELGMAQHTPDYLGAIVRLQAYARGIIGFFDTYDLLLTPSLAQRPLPIGHLTASGSDPMTEAINFTPFTPLWNVTGQPAISLPLFQGDDGLPLGIQLVGPPLGEGLLLSLAAQLEQARPWVTRQPEHGT
jgi:amidase